jgi:aconitate decarboxylase
LGPGHHSDGGCPVEQHFIHNGWKLERPITATSAQLNVAYVGAIALLDGEVFVSQFSPSRINDDDVWSMIERIDVIADPDVEALAKGSGTPRAARVSINRRGGYPIEIEVLEARGTRRRALTNSGILDKYSALVDRLIGKEKADGLGAVVLGLRHSESAGDLLTALAEPVGAIF